MDTVKFRIVCRTNSVFITVNSNKPLPLSFPYIFRKKDFKIDFRKYTWRGKLYLDAEIGPGYLQSYSLYDLAW